MKNFIKKHIWIINIGLSIIILSFVIVYLNATNRLDYLYNLKYDLFFEKLSKIETWLLSATLLSIITLNVFSNWVASLFYGYIFPSPDKTLMENTEEIIRKISGSEHILAELLKNTQLNARNIEQYLQELPIKDGKGETETKIREWYQIRKISTEEKELLIVVVSVIFEYNESLSLKINNLKINGETEIIRLLEKIQQYFTEGNADKIKGLYFSRSEQLKNENLAFLKESIKATETLFADKETKELYQELVILEPTTSNYLQYAFFLTTLKYYNEAINCYQLALDKQRTLKKTDSADYFSNLANILFNFGNVYLFTDELSKALEKHNEALGIYKELSIENPKSYLLEMTMILNSFGIIYLHKHEFEKAQGFFEEALRIYRELAIDSPNEYMPFMANELQNLGLIHREKNELPLSFERFEEALKLFRELAKENPDKYLFSVGSILNNLAYLFRIKKEFIHSFEAFAEALNTFRELAKKNPNKYLVDVGNTLWDIGFTFYENNQSIQAFEKFEESIEILREVAKDNPRLYKLRLANSLKHLAECHKEKDELRQAHVKFEEALNLYKELENEENPSTYLPDFCNTLVDLAFIHSTNKEFLRAIGYLEDAMKINEELIKRDRDTYFSYTPKILFVMAEVYLDMNKFSIADEKYEESLKIYKLLAIENPMDFEIDYAEILIMGVVKFKKYKGVLKESKNILKKYQSNSRAKSLLELISLVEKMK